jgi:methyl-accepting chemotaxis protein
MKIRTKIFLGFIIVVLIASFIGIQGVINIKKINDLDTQLYEKMTAPLSDVINFCNEFNNIRSYTSDALLAENSSDVQDYENKIKDSSSKFDASLSKVRETTLTAKGEEALKELETSKANYMDIVNKVIQLKNQGKYTDAINLMDNEGKPLSEKVQNSANTFVGLKLELAKQASDDNSKTAANTTILTIIILIIGIAIAVLIGIFISASISKPVRKIMQIANKVADGDFDVDINVQSKDEIGLLADSFRRMTEKLSITIHNINSAAEQVAAGSRQVSDSSVALAQGAMEQASSIEELTSSMEEISAQTKMNAENAANANEVAVSAKANAEDGYEQMKEMQKAVVEINNASTNIYKIIKVIDEIAFQTNILALNAAVEAARAGQHGKGFAVVAEEVRNLAARSAKAAKETADMIEGSIKKTEAGTTIADKTAEALNKIVEDTVKIADFVNQIATASNEQAEGIEQTNQGIMQVSTIVQSNSATAEESASASEELASQAEMLKEQVKQFKLKEEDAPGYSL